MRIGIDARLWDQTGVGRYIRNLVFELEKIDTNDEYVLFVLKKDFDGVKKQITNGKWRIVKADIKWHSFSEQINFLNILNKENLDLVHFPYFSVPYFYNKPYVVTIHDLIINHYPTGKASTKLLPFYLLKLTGYKYLIKKVAWKSKKIITPSFATKIEVLEHLNVPEAKVIVIYEGADLLIKSKTVKITSNKYGKYFLYVGNAYPHKNLDTLVDGFYEYKKNSGDGKLVFAGTMDYFYLRLKEKVQNLGFGDDVIFLGRVEDQDLANLYKYATALILPSKMEGFGLPVLEAMSSKCLILASGIPSVIEIASDSAYYFNPLSKEEIEGAFKKATDKNNMKEISEMIERNYKRSLEFSWKSLAEETLKVYRNAVRSS